jgi:hypothetical protein
VEKQKLLARRRQGKAGLFFGKHFKQKNNINSIVYSFCFIGNQEWHGNCLRFMQQREGTKKKENTNFKSGGGAKKN